jgi:hypothetical protein
MTDMPSGNESVTTQADHTQTPSGNVSEHVYVYASAGIAERDGHVPVWLWVVVVSLLIWGVYYLVTYWNAPLVSG